MQAAAIEDEFGHVRITIKKMQQERLGQSLTRRKRVRIAEEMRSNSVGDSNKWILPQRRVCTKRGRIWEQKFWFQKKMISVKGVVNVPGGAVRIIETWAIDSENCDYPG